MPGAINNKFHPCWYRFGCWFFSIAFDRLQYFFMECSSRTSFSKFDGTSWDWGVRVRVAVAAWYANNLSFRGSYRSNRTCSLFDFSRFWSNSLFDLFFFFTVKQSGGPQAFTISMSHPIGFGNSGSRSVMELAMSHQHYFFIWMSPVPSVTIDPFFTSINHLSSDWSLNVSRMCPFMDPFFRRCRGAH